MNDRTTAMVDNALEVLVYLTLIVVLGLMVQHGNAKMEAPFMSVVGVLLGRGVRGIVSPRANSVPAQVASAQLAAVVAPVAAAAAPPAVAAPAAAPKVGP